MTPHTFHDLPARYFPLTMRFFAGDRIVHEIEVTEPAAVWVPPLARTYGKIEVAIDFADGSRIDRDGTLHDG